MVLFQEWETITATYPPTARRLNLVTKQLDIDVYYDLGGKVDIRGMTADITLVLQRMKSKNPNLVKFDDKIDVMTVNVKERTDVLKARSKPFIIYHQANVTRADSTINVQIRVENPLTTKMAIMAKYDKMPITKSCDFVKVVTDIERVDEEFMDWHITTEEVNNRTGSWYFGVVAIDTESNVTDVLTDMASCEDSGLESLKLSQDFGVETYDLR